MIPPELNEFRMLSLKAVRQLIPLSRATIYSRMKNGTFPQAIKIGPRSIAWPLKAILDFIENPSRYQPESE
jgi:Predicted transcriptional regulator